MQNVYSPTRRWLLTYFVPLVQARIRMTSFVSGADKDWMTCFVFPTLCLQKCCGGHGRIFWRIPEYQTRYETRKEQSICLEEEYRYSSTPSLTLALDGGGWSTPRPGRSTPRKESRYPTVQEPGCAPGHKISSPTGNVHVIINIYFVMLLLHVSALIHLLQGRYLEGTHL